MTVAIHRVGPAPDTTPYRQNLGRVLVTIDDLQALMDLIYPTLVSGVELQVQFDGGYFTAAEDLRHLSDVETRTLRIHTVDMEILLDASQAFVIGDEGIAGDVYHLWARSRQLTLARNFDRALKVGAAIIVIAAIGFALYVTYLNVQGIEIADETRTTASYIVIPILYTIIGAGLLLKRRAPLNAAVIKPFTLNEYRQYQRNNRWPKWAVIVAIAAIAFGVATAFLVPLLTG